MPLLKDVFLNDVAYNLATWESEWINFDSAASFSLTVYSNTNVNVQLQYAIDNQFQVIETETLPLTGPETLEIKRSVKSSFVKFSVINIVGPIDLKIQGYFFQSQKPGPTGDDMYSGGWASYTDSKTSLNPQIIGTSPTLYLNDATSGPRNYSRGKAIWDATTNSMIGVEGRAYTIRFNFTAIPLGPANFLTFVFDIGSESTPSNIISQRSISFLKGTGNPNKYSTTTSVFALSTFQLNSMRIFLLVDGGTCEIYDSNIFIQCVYDNYRF